jgi:polyribonucleotide nucleotidyltransferase
MLDALSVPKEDLSTYAPRIEKIKIKPSKIGELIGPGGKTIKSIIESTGCSIDVADDGTVTVLSKDKEGAERAKEVILGITIDAEIGKVYEGIVKRITDFGAFIEILPGKEGLLHISQIDTKRVEKVTDYLSEGEETKVLVLDIDGQGRIRLSRKKLVEEAAAKKEETQEEQLPV